MVHPVQAIAAPPPPKKRRALRLTTGCVPSTVFRVIMQRTKFNPKQKQKELNRNAVSRNSTRPGTAVSMASIMSDRIEMQTNYVETRHKAKISAGKKRRLMKSAEKFLDKSTTPEKRAKARAKSVTMEEILRWKDECKLDFAVEDLHRYAVYRDERKRRGLKSRGILPPMDHTPQVKINQARIKARHKETYIQDLRFDYAQPSPPDDLGGEDAVLVEGEPILRECGQVVEGRNL